MLYTAVPEKRSAFTHSFYNGIDIYRVVDDVGHYLFSMHSSMQGKISVAVSSSSGI